MSDNSTKQLTLYLQKEYRHLYSIRFLEKGQRHWVNSDPEQFYLLILQKKIFIQKIKIVGFERKTYIQDESWWISEGATVQYEQNEEIKKKKHEEFMKNQYPFLLKTLNDIIVKNKGHLALGKVLSAHTRTHKHLHTQTQARRYASNYNINCH